MPPSTILQSKDFCASALGFSLTSSLLQVGDINGLGAGVSVKLDEDVFQVTVYGGWRNPKLERNLFVCATVPYSDQDFCLSGS